MFHRVGTHRVQILRRTHTRTPFLLVTRAPRSGLILADTSALGWLLSAVLLGAVLAHPCWP